MALLHTWAVPAGMHRDSVMLNLRQSDASAVQAQNNVCVVVFSYGAVVFFNVTDELREKCLESFRPLCAEMIPDGFQPMEDYSIILRPPVRDVPIHRARLPYDEWQSVIHFDYAALPQLDVHNLAVIATVLAQSIALDQYSVNADAMLEAFTRLNSSVERTGVFTTVEKKSLFRLVALNNTIFADVIAKIGVLERSDTAWKYLEYADVWEQLREEFEIENRFQKIEFKLNLIQQNSKFFLEVLAGDKSNTLEWIIIILISIEIIVMTVEIVYHI